jgi:hydrogenase expression/formation protein HypD
LLNLPKEKKTVCKCGEVLKGIIEPINCPLFANKCTPINPIGACMVSSEGSCHINYLFKKEK